MPDAFTVKVLLSFIVAGIWITLATVLSERFGTKIGGMLGNLPSNILVSLLFMGWTQGAVFAAEAAKVGPLAMIIDTVFLFIYIVALQKYGKFAPLIALAAWFILALPVGMAGFNDLYVGIAGYAVVVIVAFYFLERRMSIPSMKKKKTSYSISELALRAIISGGIVSGAVVLAAIGGPVWGGLFSAFPAVMLSTMYLLTRAQGSGFAQATGKVMVPASANIVVFCLAVYFTYPIYGLIAGTVISYLAALAFVALLYPLMRKVA